MTTKSRRWLAHFAAVALLALVGGHAATAAPINFSYSSVGSVAGGGVTGTDIVGIDSVASNTVDMSGTYKIGTFTVGKLGAGKATTYNNTPISVTLVNPDLNPIKLTGTLTGTIDGDGKSAALAKFDLAAPFAFDYMGGSHTLTLAQKTYELKNNMTVPINAALAFSTPVPEPATLVVLAAGVLGYGLRRRLRRDAA